MNETSRLTQEMPQSIESERALLGGLLLDSRRLLEIGDMLAPADFYRAQHGRLYALMLEMERANCPVELVSVTDKLAATGRLDSVGGLSYISSLSDDAPSTENLRYYAEQVLDRARRRRLIEGLSEALEAAYDGNEALGEVVSETERRVLAVTRRHDRAGWESVGSAVAKLVTATSERQAAPRMSGGMPTGYHELDRLVNGLRRQQLVILAARPAMGKSSLASNICEHFCDQGIGVGFFSMEMSSEQVAMRVVAGRASVPLGRLLGASLSRAEWRRVRLAADAMDCDVRHEAGATTFRFRNSGAYPFFVDETPNLSLVALRRRALRLKADQPSLGLIVVDYAQLMAEEYRGQKRQEAVAANFRGLKNLAKEMDVPVIALSQLNRELERRPDKRPVLSDLRESGEAEQAADVVAFIYRDEVYNKKTDERGVAEIIVSKQRDGGLGTVKLMFEGPFCRFENLPKCWP